MFLINFETSHSSETLIISRPSGTFIFFADNFGITAFLNPSFAISDKRFSNCDTPLISPPHPTSPINTYPSGIGMSQSPEITAAQIPKSAAVSSIFKPPATLIYTS